MGLAINSIKDTFYFFVRNPGVLVYAVMIFLINLAGVSLIFVSILSFLLLPLQQGMLGVTEMMELGMMNLILLGMLGGLGIGIVIVGNLLMVGGFPLLVKQVIERRKVRIIPVIKESTSRMLSVLAALIIVGIILLVPYFSITIGASGIFYGGFKALSPLFPSPPFWLVGILAGVVAIGVVAAIYLTARLWLVIPALMVEKRGVVESLKISWRMSKGKILSIVVVFILAGLIVVLPLHLIGFGVKLSVPALEAFWNFISSVLEGIFYSSLATFYYYNLKREVVEF